MQETWVRSLGWEDRLEKGKATHGSVLAWRIPWTEAPGGLQSVGLQRLKRDTVTESSFLLPPSFSLLKILSRIPSNLAFTPCISPRLLLLKSVPGTRVTKFKGRASGLISGRWRVSSGWRPWCPGRRLLFVFLLAHPAPPGFPGGSADKESACTAGDLGSIPGSGRSPGEGTATHSSILAQIPRTVQSKGSQSQT